MGVHKSQFHREVTPCNLVMIVLTWLHWSRSVQHACIWTCLGANMCDVLVSPNVSLAHHGYRSSWASPLCVVIQQDCWAAGAAAGAAGWAAGDGLRWAVSGALHRLVQAVHRPLLMPCGRTDTLCQFGSRCDLWMDSICACGLSLMSTCDEAHGVNISSRFYR